MMQPRFSTSRALLRAIVRCVFVTTLLALFGASVASAQIPPDSTTGESIERILESIDEDAGDASQLIDFLANLRENPIDVNTAAVAELSQIPSLDEMMAFAIVAFRNANGPFRSLPELQLVDGITEDRFIEARPYLAIGPSIATTTRKPSPYPRSPSLRDVTNGLRYSVIQRVTRRVDVGSGYETDTSRTTYSGSPERVYTRLRASYGRRVSFNFTGEKDPGEVFEWNPENQSFGYDHVTTHLGIRDFGRVQSFVLGDYALAFGQGLVFWKGLSAGKGRDVIAPVTRSGNGIAPYGSTDENSFLRGVATTLRITPQLSVSGFVSRRSLDATISEVDTTSGFDPLDEFGSIEESGFTNTGLHRTETEIARRDAIRESLVGGNVEYVGDRLRVGSVAYKSVFDTPIVPGQAAYERYRFSGTDVGIASLYGSAFLGSYQLFGEVARDQDGNVAGIAGSSVRIGRSARAVISARSYPRSFTNLHSFAFGESNGSTQNESGLYLGVQVQPSRQWKVAGYFDQYRFPWVRFGVPRPSRGYETLIVAEHKPRRWLVAYLQLRSETKEGGFRIVDRLGRTIDGVRDETKQSARLNLQYEFSKQLTLRSRLEGTRFRADNDEAQYGTLLFQDFRWRVTKTIMLDGRLMLFDTDGFDARVFTYEYDLRYTFSIPSFSGQGQRTYLMLTLSPVESIYFQLKYAVTKFQNVETVGSGLDEVEGDRVRDVRAQLLWRF